MKRFVKISDERTIALLIMALSILLGLACPPLSRALNPVALPALFLVVLFSLAPFATISRNELVQISENVWRVLVWQQIVLPSIVVALGVLCRFPDNIISLLVVTACSGALFASPALAALLNLDRRQSLQCMVLSTLMMPVSMLAFLTMFHGSHVNMDVKLYLLRIVIYLLVPAMLFLAYRKLALLMRAPVRLAIEGGARWAVVIALSVFGIGMMWRVTQQLAVDPVQILFFLVLTTVLCVGMLAVTTIVMYRFGLSDALTAAILSGFRNVGLGYALIGDMIGPELAAYVGVALLPVFTAPLAIKIIADRHPHIGQAETGPVAAA